MEEVVVMVDEEGMVKEVVDEGGEAGRQRGDTSGGG